MLFNAQKSNHLSIGIAAALPERTDAVQRVYVNGVVVPPCTEHNHLGVIVNKRLSRKELIEYVHSACSRQVGMLLRMREWLTRTSLVKIYKGFIRPRMELVRFERRKHHQAE